MNLPPPQDPWAGQPGQSSTPRPGHGPHTPPGPPGAHPGTPPGNRPPTVPGRTGDTVPGYNQPVYGGPAYGPPAFGPPAGPPGYGPPAGAPGSAAFGVPPTSMFSAPPATVSKWRPWHKKVLGVVGVLTLVLCGAALFDPDSDTDKSPGPAESPAVAALQQAATDTPKTEATTTAKAKPTRTATTKPSPTRKATKSAKPVYYADCDAAPGELTRTDPGYRKALDRDGDGVACESGGDDDEPIEDEEPTGGTDPRYRTCAAANDAGLGPYRRGLDPEYSWYQDRDGDGVVCER
ncbi:excalibur calcium-binding domain-containing protein [Actinoplanes sp. CA-252034]|uniref:excalibur calcium-binding domain-containing protein n=1 Tax=Actinoplanes sp. CA-252034 TaxID=3239906 RepID=UPI003D99BB37